MRQSTSKIALLTGVTSGFGQLVAEHVASKQYNVVFFARSTVSGELLIERVRKKYPTCSIEMVQCDLASFESIKAACQTVSNKYSHIDLMVQNAGLWNSEWKETVDGIEETLQVNLLAPIYIFKRLKALLLQHNDSKVVFTASGLYQGTINLEDLELRSNYSGFKAYRQSKLGIILMTRLLAAEKSNETLKVVCVHPGMVRTKLGRQAGWLSRTIFHLLGQPIEKGANTHRFVISEPAGQLLSGGFYEKSHLGKTKTKESNDLELVKKINQAIIHYLNQIGLNN